MGGKELSRNYSGCPGRAAKMFEQTIVSCARVYVENGAALESAVAAAQAAAAAECWRMVA